MTDEQKIVRLEKTLGTLITWLALELGEEAMNDLLTMLMEEPNDDQ